MFCLKSRHTFVRVCAVTAICLLAMAVDASATTCNVSHGNCDATVQLSVFTGSPTVICLIGHPVVLIEVTVTCSGSSDGPFTKKICGVQSNAFVFSALGYTHTLEPKSGFDWEDILNGNCGELKYRRNPN